MLGQADLVAERLVAQVAGVGPLAVVGPAGVHLQAVGGREEFLAFHAGVDIAQRKGSKLPDRTARCGGRDGTRD